MTKHYCDECGKELEEGKIVNVQLNVFGPEIFTAPIQYELCRSCLERHCGPERVKRWYEDTPQVRKRNRDLCTTAY